MDGFVGSLIMAVGYVLSFVIVAWYFRFCARLIALILSEIFIGCLHIVRGIKGDSYSENQYSNYSVEHKTEPTLINSQYQNTPESKRIARCESKFRNAIPTTYEEANDCYLAANDLLCHNNITTQFAELSEMDRAVILLKRASAYGHVDALLLLANYYETVEKTPSNDVKMIECFQKAADLGSEPAMSKLAVYYFSGRGCAVDKAKALTWMRKSMEKGYMPELDRDLAVYEQIKEYEINNGTRHSNISLEKDAISKKVELEKDPEDKRRNIDFHKEESSARVPSLREINPFSPAEFVKEVVSEVVDYEKEQKYTFPVIPEWEVKNTDPTELDSKKVKWINNNLRMALSDFCGVLAMLKERKAPPYEQSRLTAKAANRFETVCKMVHEYHGGLNAVRQLEIEGDTHQSIHENIGARFQTYFDMTAEELRTKSDELFEEYEAYLSNTQDPWKLENTSRL